MKFVEYCYFGRFDVFWGKDYCFFKKGKIVKD